MVKKNSRNTAPKTNPAAKKAARTRTSSPQIEARLAKLGLVHDMDFVVHIPLRYEDETRITPIQLLRPGEHVLIQGTVLNKHVQYRPRRQLLVTLADDTGQIKLRWLHFYPNQLATLKEGALLRFKGEARRGFYGLEMVHPNIRSVNRPLSTTLTPIYSTTAGLSQAQLSKAIQAALKRADLTDTIPTELLKKYRLWPFKQAVTFLHHPEQHTDINQLIDK